MSHTTSIEWTDVTWNPVRGCSLVSAGCANCYAMKQAHRFSGKGKPYEGLTEIGPQGPRWTGKITLVPEALEEPLHWKKPRLVFVNSMSDLFHEDVPDEFVYRAFIIMAQCQRHTFQILTNRPERMRRFARRISYINPGFNGLALGNCSYWPNDPDKWPIETRHLPNVWLGVSVEDQRTADERIPLLLQTPAAVRWISAEPLLGPVSLKPWISLCRADLVTDEHGRYSEIRHNAANQMRVFSRREAWAMHWVIVGGESGPGARPCDLAWIRSIKDQCQAARVPVFVKQIGSQPRGWCAGIAYSGEPQASFENDYCDLYEASEIAEPCKGKCMELVDKKGGDMAEWPEDLRVREFP